MTPGLGRDPFDDVLATPTAPRRPPAAADPSAKPARRVASRTFELPVELIEQVRDAAWALSGPPHQLTLNALAADALRHELERLQAEHNDGQPFPTRRGPLRRGRRLAG